MVIVLLCFNVALLFFGIYMILYGEEKYKEYEQKLEIQEKLFESIKNRLDNHNL